MRTIYNPLTDWQTQASTGYLIRGVKATKGLEDLLVKLGRYPNTVVSNREQALIFPLLGCGLDKRPGDSA